MSIDRAAINVVAEQGTSTVSIRSVGNVITTDRITTQSNDGRLKGNLAQVAGTIWERMDDLSEWNGQAAKGIEDLNHKLFHLMGLHVSVDFKRPYIHSIPVGRDGNTELGPCILITAQLDGFKDPSDAQLIGEELAITRRALLRLKCVRMEEYGTPSVNDMEI